MDKSKPKKILISVDGSQRALDAVRYASKILSLQQAEIVLFHVITRVPESFWDLEKEPAYHYRIANVSEWERQQEKMLELFMDEARQILLSAGLPQDSLTVKIQDRKEGIARDIISESRNGYDAVVLGRKGLSQLKDLVLGSIADKLIGKLVHAPMWIVGSKPYSGKLLLSVDASEGAMQAVAHVSEILKDSPPCEVTLFHAVRGVDTFLQGFGEAFALAYEREWIERTEKELEQTAKEIEPLLEAAKSRMVESGIDPNMVKIKISKGVGSRAGAIMDEAEQGGYSTIVVGRRGLSKIQEFLIGRVSNKVVQLAKDQTVWVVN